MQALAPRSRRLGKAFSAACLLAMACAGASAQSLGVTATILSKSKCKFNTASMTLDFGTIDPSSTSNRTATGTVEFVCNGSAAMATYLITANDGLHSTGPGLRRLRHTVLASEYMAYSLALSPASATVPKGVPQILTVSGTIAPASFANARAGTFNDTVVLSITP